MMRRTTRSTTLQSGMATAVEVAVDTYIRAWSETDGEARAKMIEACFAADGRIVMRGREVRGRAALAEEMKRILADPELSQIRVISAVDARGTTFRFRAVVERRDGARLESFDAGEIDAEGRISVLLTFAGPLPETP